MRRLLDGLYDAAAALAALFMVLLLVMVMLSILGRQLHFNLPGVDAYAGYMMAGAGFLALAHTFKRGEHIRVTLLLSQMPPRLRRAFEIWSLFAASGVAVLFAFYSSKLAWQSRAFHDVSTASDATPLWLPQLTMALGSLILAIAFLDELVLELRGRRPRADAGDELLRNE
jgi:TRAP-type C4-dicarboxylate transport system permease small subunit